MKNHSLLMIALWLPLAFFSQGFTFHLPIHGDHIAIFSCAAIVLPLIGCLLPRSTSIALVAAVWLLFKVHHPLPLTLGIPTILATLSWHLSGKNHKSATLFHILMPLASIALFAASEVGREALPYSFYWLIPIACTLIQPNLWSRALQSTFVAHAAGSLIWLYFSPLTSAHWMALIPIVAVERFIAAGVAASIATLLFKAKGSFSLDLKSAKAAVQGSR